MDVNRPAGGLGENLALESPYLETLILQDPFDGSILAAGHHLRLEDHTKRAIADDFAL